MDMVEDHPLRCFRRFAGAREIASVVGITVGDTSARRAVLTYGIATDAADAGAALLGLREGGPRRAELLICSLAGAATALGIVALAGEPVSVGGSSAEG